VRKDNARAAKDEAITVARAPLVGVEVALVVVVVVVTVSLTVVVGSQTTDVAFAEPVRMNPKELQVGASKVKLSAPASVESVNTESEHKPIG